METWVASEGASVKRPPFLIVDDDVDFAKALARIVAPIATPVLAYSAHDAVRSPVMAWAGLLLDFHLGDGDGLAVLQALRSRGEVAPALFVTAYLDDTLALHAFRGGARVVPKPINVADIRAFATAAVESLADARFVRIAERWRKRYGFTTRETQIFAELLAGASRGDVAGRKMILPDTLKRHVRNIIQKTGDERLNDALLRALREALMERFAPASP